MKYVEKVFKILEDFNPIWMVHFTCFLFSKTGKMHHQKYNILYVKMLSNKVIAGMNYSILFSDE